MPGQHRLLAAAIDGDDDDERKSREFGGLQLERAKGEPSLCPEGYVPEMGEHSQQRQHDQAVEHVAPLLEPVIVDQGHDDHHDEADSKPDELTLQVVLRVSVHRDLAHTCRRIHHDRADE